MTTYIQAQFNKVRDLASAESATIQFTLQIVGPVGKTNHLNITIAQINAIQKIGGIKMRIRIGAQASNRNDKQIGFISNIFEEDGKTILVIEDEYEIPVYPGDVEEIIDLVRGLSWFRIKTLP